MQTGLRGARARGGSDGGRAAQVSPFGVPVQPKLTIGPARDRYESEADRAADHVMAGRGGAPAITPLGSPPAQRAPQEDEEPLQRKTPEEEEPVQRKAMQEEEVQRDATGAAPAASPAVEGGIRSARGGGAPLPDATRGRMETGFGRDFSAVRVHDDSRADRMNAAIDARAFTSGSDIFFSRGAYAPGTATGDRLLAHELTHVAQQTGPGRVQARRIQRDGPDSPETDEEERPRSWQDSGDRKRGVDLDGPNGRILFRLPQLLVPRIGGKCKGVSAHGSITGGFGEGRGAGHGNFLPGSGVFHWTGKGSRTVTDEEGQTDNSTQVQIWERYISNNGDLAGKIRDTFEQTDPKISRGGDGGPRVYYLRNRKARSDLFTPIGTAEELARASAILRPPFDKDREFKLMEVDHYIEIQLGGAHDISNMWLLDRKANGASGRKIKDNVKDDLNSLAEDAARGGLWGNGNPSKPGFRSWPDNADIDFGRVEGYRLDGSFWDKTNIVDGDQLDALRPLRAAEMAEMGFTFDPDVTPEQITIFLSRNSPYRRVMQLSDGQLSYEGRRGDRDFISGFNLHAATYTKPTEIAEGQQIATLTGQAFGNRTVPLPDGSRSKAIKVDKVLNVPVLSKLDAGFGGYIDRAYIDQALRSEAAARLAKMSPLNFTSVGLTDTWELAAQASVRSDLPLIDGFEFTLRVVGDAIMLDVAVPTDSLQFDPFRVTEANISVGYGENGPIWAGMAAFAIDGVGTGTVTANREELSGSFSFDSTLFDPADVTVTYRDGAWSGEGELGIGAGTLPYVEGASIRAGFSEEGAFFVDGTVDLVGPGIPAGTQMTVAYDDETKALTIGGEVPLDTSRFPGVRNARLAATVSRDADGAWSVAGSGSAAFDLPGVTGDLDVGYDGGIITIDGTATVSRPPLTGSAEFHLSNQAVDDASQPVPGPPLDTFRVWGSGSASIAFGEYITATVGITFLENGEIEMQGTIALPPSIPLVAEERYEYDILDIPRVDFPIIGFTIPVIGRNFGVFGFVRGGVDAEFVVGPVALVNSEVTVTYNPDHQEDMSITGGTTLEASASAEIGLSVTGGVGAGLGIVEATGEIGIRGGLGLALTGGGAIQIDWTPTRGLDLDATIFGEARPKFTIALIAEARVEVDALLWSGTLWDREWERELGAFGPDMFWRAELPATWSEEDGLDIDLDQLVLHRPDIDVPALAEDIFDAVR